MSEEKNGKILLESGTNEIEIMEFTIGGNLYGINVAKVREIMMSAPVKPMPMTHPAVEGIFKPRDTVITVGIDREDLYQRALKLQVAAAEGRRQLSD